MRRAIVTGASSGIGRALALQLAREGWQVVATARREALLAELASEMGPPSLVRTMDVAQPEAAAAVFAEIVAAMGGVELVILNAGAGHINPGLDWELERETIDVNVRGFTALADAAFTHFLARGPGHLVGISSIAGRRGHGAAPAYGASKAYVSTYLDALRHRAARLGARIDVTDVLPGYVDTAMAKGPHVFWAASPEKAARQILDAVRRRRPRAIVTKRWAALAWITRLIPDAIYHRMG